MMLEYWVAELGSLLLYSTFVMSVLGAGLGFHRYAPRRLLGYLSMTTGEEVSALLSKLSVLVTGGLVLSFAVLCWCFVSNDFSVLYVANNSHSELSWVYRLCAVWGAHEGSMLLWTVFLSVWMLVFSLKHPAASKDTLLSAEVRTTILSVLFAILAGFVLFLLATSSPFIRDLPFPVQEGADLNPLLQDPGFIIHPPTLYNGYVGLSIPFAIAIAALIHSLKDWARLAYPWALGALGFLIAGISLGSWWAYYELGWGGWWFWDPVENASLMPALVALALVHCLMVARRQPQAYPLWTIFLALLAFSLSLLGTFLVRSGIVSSVHSFASSPARGLFILGFFALLSGLAFGLFAMRGERMAQLYPPSAWHQGPASHRMIYCASLLLLVIMLTIMLGTLYPLLIEAFTNDSLSVGAPYFNKVVLPIAVPLIFLCVLGVSGASSKSTAVIERAIVHAPSIVGACCFAAICLVFLLNPMLQDVLHGSYWSLALGAGLGAALLTSLVPYIHLRIKRGWMAWAPGALAHTGLAVFIVGISFSSVLSTEKEVTLSVGDTTSVGAYRFHLVALERFDNPHDEGITATVEVVGPWTHTKLLTQKRYFKARDLVMTETALRPSLINDLYVALGNPLSPTTWSMRLYLKPFVRWIWVGGALMALGSLLGMMRSKRSVAA